jgi:hypothetical protein
MHVSEIMSRPPITVLAGSDLMPAMDLMIERGVSGLMVLNDAGTLCGILSEGDLLRRIELDTSVPAKAWWSTVFASMDLAAAYRIAHGVGRHEFEPDHHRRHVDARRDGRPYGDAASKGYR